MSVFSLILGLFTPTAHARSLDSWGSSNPAIADMWQTIRNTLYTRQDPVQALSGATINFIFPLIGGVAVLLILYAGIKMITGRGKEEAVSEAKTIVMYALIGVVLAMLATAIVGYFGTVFFPTLFD